MCNIICNIELVSYVYNVSHLMLTMNVLPLLIASIQIVHSVPLCFYWFKGSVSDVMVVLHTHWCHVSTWRAPSHWPPALFCHSKDTDKHICSCSSVLTKHVMHLRLHLTLWAHSPMYHPPWERVTGGIGEGYRACGPVQKSVFNEGFVYSCLFFYPFPPRKHVLNIYIFIISENYMNHGQFYVAKWCTFVIREMP